MRNAKAQGLAIKSPMIRLCVGKISSVLLYSPFAVTERPSHVIIVNAPNESCELSSGFVHPARIASILVRERQAEHHNHGEGNATKRYKDRRS